VNKASLLFTRPPKVESTQTYLLCTNKKNI
jgi:hypothetical protein